jgi:hypothetical protein
MVENMKKMAYWRQDHLEAKIDEITRRLRVQDEEVHGLKVFTNKKSEALLKKRSRQKAVEDGLLDWLGGVEAKREALKKSLQPTFRPTLCKASLTMPKSRQVQESGMQQ